MSSLKTEWKGAYENLNQAIQAWRDRNVLFAIEMLRKSYESAPGDQGFYWSAFDTLRKEKAWLLAAMMAFNPHTKDAERDSVDRVLQLHEVQYRAAVDPLAAEFISNNSVRPLFLIANLRYELYSKNIVAQDIKDNVATISNDPKQANQFPEIYLIAMEIAFVNKDKANTMSQSQSIEFDYSFYAQGLTS